MSKTINKAIGEPIEDSKYIDRPEKIISDFHYQTTAFENYRFLLHHLTDLMATGFFVGYDDLAFRSFSDNYYMVAEAIFKLEQHAADEQSRYSIINFMRHVLRKSEPEIKEVSETLHTMIAQYGSIVNALHHISKQTSI